MDEDISIINSNTRNEKIKNFFINNKKSLILTLTLLILTVISYFGYSEIQENKNTISRGVAVPSSGGVTCAATLPRLLRVSFIFL